VGIPAPTFSLGFTAFDDAINKYYHQPSDQPNNLDYDYLQKFFSAYVYASRLIANAKETPFWKPGDKYFEAGKQLYGKN
ncbi:MAG: aminopeptidase, partial [Bernardetiaceae bacterium]|nr:aminopeptidase [Bernardetiaceae bacterium]